MKTQTIIVRVPDHDGADIEELTETLYNIIAKGVAAMRGTLEGPWLAGLEADEHAGIIEWKNL